MPAGDSKPAFKTDPPSAAKTININVLAEAAPGLIPSLQGGAQLFGDYELLAEIARGGMGVVYKARQISLNRIVAVKMILAGQLAGEAEVKRFRTEAEAAAQLHHPNIVAIHEVGEHEGHHYFSMNLVVGTGLDSRLADGPLAIGEAVGLVKTIAEAVHFAHGRGIVHRDLKPANVLLDEFGQPRITDFGVAKRLEHRESMTMAGAMLGTPDYMSPEQAAGRHDIAGPPCDIFSLGAMLYQLITGRVPFRGSNLAETLSNILQKEPIPPSRVNPRVPADLETICLKCLEKRSDRRYATAQALAADLGRFLDHEAVLARPAGASKRFAGWLKTNPRFLAGLASAVLLAVIWFGCNLWFENRIFAWEKVHSTGTVPVVDWSYKPQYWKMVTLALIFFIAGLQNLLGKQTRSRVITGRFVPPRTLALFELAGLSAVALSVWLGAAEIQTWLWAKHALPRAYSELDEQLVKEDEAAALDAEQLAKIKEQIKALQKHQAAAQSALHPAVAGPRDATEPPKQLTPKALEFQRGLLEAKLDSENSDVETRQSDQMELEIEKILKQASSIWLAPSLLLPAAGVWFGATLMLSAFREHGFVFYRSVEEEQAALARAVTEQQQAAAEEARRLRDAIRYMILPAVLLILVFPCFYWGTGQEMRYKLALVFAELGAFAFSVVAALRSWRSAARRHSLHRGILVVFFAVAAGAIVYGPATLVWRGAVFGIATGMPTGLFFCWVARQTAAPPA